VVAVVFRVVLDPDAALISPRVSEEFGDSVAESRGRVVPVGGGSDIKLSATVAGTVVVVGVVGGVVEDFEPSVSSTAAGRPSHGSPPTLSLNSNCHITRLPPTITTNAASQPAPDTIQPALTASLLAGGEAPSTFRNGTVLRPCAVMRSDPLDHCSSFMSPANLS